MLLLPWRKNTAWCPRLASSNSCFHDDKQALTSSYSYSHSVIVPAVRYHGNRAAKVCMIKPPVLCVAMVTNSGLTHMAVLSSRYLFLWWNGEFVTCYEAAHLFHAQIEKLLALHDLGKVLLCECQWVGESKRDCQTAFLTPVEQQTTACTKF